MLFVCIVRSRGTNELQLLPSMHGFHVHETWETELTEIIQQCNSIFYMVEVNFRLIHDSSMLLHDMSRKWQ